MSRCIIIFAVIILSLLSVTRSDFVCSTSGNFGCNLKCGISKRGSGDCKNVEEKEKCICFQDDVDFGTQSKLSVEEVDEESFWEDVNIDEEYIDQEYNIENNEVDQKETQNSTSDDFTEKVSDNKYLPWILQKIIFYPAERKGFFGFLQDITKPSTYGLNNAVNFRIPCENGSLGAWFITPTGSESKTLKDLSSNDTLAVYLHGSSATRGYSHRVNTYRKLVGMGYYVLAFDYRGYADSSKVLLSEGSVVNDTLTVLKWINSTLREDQRPLMLVWGHSLGGAIATNSMLQWQNTKSDLTVHGIVLESTFNNMADEIHRFALGRWMTGWLGQNHTAILKSADAEFLSSEYLPQIKAPTLLLHADNDRLVPSYLGERLYKAALEGGKNNTRFVLFPADMRLGHKYIYSAPGLALDIKEIEEEAKMFRMNENNNLDENNN